MIWLSNAFDFLCKGGFVMWPLLACSVVSITVVIERYVRLKNTAGDSMGLMARVEKYLALGKHGEAVRLCDEDGTPVGVMLAAGLKCSSPGSAERCMEEEALKVTPPLFRRLSVLDTIVTIAPLLGLLGTVTGLIRSFNAMSQDIGAGITVGVTGGIAEALITSATGIAIAIVTLVAYNYLAEKAKSIISDMELYGTRLVNILTSSEEEECDEAQAV